MGFLCAFTAAARPDARAADERCLRSVRQRARHGHGVSDRKDVHNATVSLHMCGLRFHVFASRFSQILFYEGPGLCRWTSKYIIIYVFSLMGCFFPHFYDTVIV